MHTKKTLVITCTLLSLIILSGCGISQQIGQVGEMVQNQKEQIQGQVLDTIEQKSAEYKQTIITTINNARVTALPDIQGLETQLETTIKETIGQIAHREQEPSVSSKKDKQADKQTSNATIQCLQQQGLTYYTASTCTFAAQQREVLQDTLDYFTSIYCDPESDLATCKQAGIQGTPARSHTNQGKILYGVQSLEQLAKEFGCL